MGNEIVVDDASKGSISDSGSDFFAALDAGILFAVD